MTSVDPVCRERSTRSADPARWVILIMLVASFVPSLAGGATKGRIAGQAQINSEPAAGAVVYLHPLDGRPLPATPTVSTVRQEHLRFTPDFLVVPAGTTVRFENHDDEIHNIHSRSNENRFDTGAHLPSTVKEVMLKHPGVVPLRCRTHQNMRGLIIVTPSPYFSVTDNLGRFEIQDVPTDRYRIAAWHRQITPEEAARGGVVLDLESGANTVQLRFTARAGAGTDLTETTGLDWTSVVEQIRAELDLAIALWKRGSITAATAKVMNTHSRLYGESGLREAISQISGKVRAAEHERRLDALRKRTQGIGTETTTESILKDEVAALVAGLMRDTEKMTAP